MLSPFPFEAKVRGKEQLILLPLEPRTYTLTTDDSMSIEMNTGLHFVVFSGIAGIFKGGSQGQEFLTPRDGFKHRSSIDDDDEWQHDVTFLVGPLWRDLVQVSAGVSPGGIVSLDSDDVDHSAWQLNDCSWKPVDVDGSERIQLTLRITTQGAENGWINFTYQVAATGSLMRLPAPADISADI